MENKMRREIDRKRAEEIGEIQKMKRERESEKRYKQTDRHRDRQSDRQTYIGLERY